jgi:protein O-mannosyl-transferase
MPEALPLTAPSTRKRATAGLVLALAALCFVVYANSLHGAFVYDDIENVLDNHWIRDVRYLYEIFTMHSAGFAKEYAARYYRPLVQVIYMADYHLFGLDSWGYHFVSVILHTIVTVLVFAVSLEIFGGGPDAGRDKALPAAFAAAVLFAVHPVHTEAVSWISGVMDLSYSAFYLASFYMYINAFEGGVPRTGYYALSLAAFLASALCKEPALTLPAVLFAYDLIFRKGLAYRLREIAVYIPYAVIALVYMVVRWHALGGFYKGTSPASHGGLMDALNAFTLFSGYMAKLLFPVNLNADYMFRPASSVLDPKWLASFVFVAVLAATAWAARKNRPAMMGAALMVVPLLPVLYLPALGVSAFADRYLYLPSAGYTVILASMFASAGRGPGKTAAAAAVLLLVTTASYAAATVNRNPAWRDGIALWSDSIKKSPDNPTAHRSLGFALDEAGRYEQSAAEYETALRLKPNDVYTRVNLGKVYKEIGRDEDAYRQYMAALKIKPDLVEAHYNLGNYYLDKGLYDDAVKQYRDVLQAQPNYARAYTNMGAACLHMGRDKEAEESLLTGIGLDSYDPDAYNNLGIVYARAGMYDKAAESFRQAARLNPDNQSYRNNLDNALSAAGIRN